MGRAPRPCGVRRAAFPPRPARESFPNCLSSGLQKFTLVFKQELDSPIIFIVNFLDLQFAEHQSANNCKRGKCKNLCILLQEKEQHRFVFVNAFFSFPDTKVSKLLLMLLLLLPLLSFSSSSFYSFLSSFHGKSNHFRILGLKCCMCLSVDTVANEKLM